jgi:guanylate kinase
MKFLITITAPSCSGKTYLLDYLENSKKYQKIPTYTTRAQRSGEIDGDDYHFTNEAEIRDIQGKHGGFIELNYFNGFFYGMPKGYFDYTIENTNGKIPVIICTPEGVQVYEEYCKKNDIQLIKAYLQADEHVRIERLMRRIYLDSCVQSETIPPSEITKKAITAGINRCRDMYVKENFWFGMNKWDLILDGYDHPLANTILIQRKLKLVEERVLSL